MAQHNSYWSCSKFADWLRGTPKPNSETSDGWRRWRKQAESAHPWRYWLADDGLGYLQDFVTWPIRKIYDVKYYVNNRWVTRTHTLTAHPRDIRPGTWCDVGNRFLPCLFNELVDFVEIELAWWHIVWESSEFAKKYNAPFWSKGWFRWRTWRCKQAGLDNLDWQRSLRWQEEEVAEGSENLGKLTPQAEKAQEILDLYTWWTVTRPARPDPIEVSGWSAYCDRRRAADPDDWIFSDNKEDTGPMLDQMHQLEAKYEQEDEEMMIRLIRVRHGLWT